MTNPDTNKGVTGTLYGMNYIAQGEEALADLLESISPGAYNDENVAKLEAHTKEAVIAGKREVLIEMLDDECPKYSPEGERMVHAERLEAELAELEGGGE